MKLTFNEAKEIRQEVMSFFGSAKIRMTTGDFQINQIKVVPSIYWVLHPFDSPVFPSNEEGQFDLLIQFDADTIMPFSSLFDNPNILAIERD